MVESSENGIFSFSFYCALQVLGSWVSESWVSGRRSTLFSKIFSARLARVEDCLQISCPRRSGTGGSFAFGEANSM